MKNLLRIVVLFIVIAVVFCVSKFLMEQNKNYIKNDSVPPVIQSGEVVNTEILESTSGEEVVLESGEIIDISGDLSEVILESGDVTEGIFESTNVTELNDNEVLKSGEIIEIAEIIESEELVSGELAE